MVVVKCRDTIFITINSYDLNIVNESTSSRKHKTPQRDSGQFSHIMGVYVSPNGLLLSRGIIDEFILSNSLKLLLRLRSHNQSRSDEVGIKFEDT